MLESSTVVGALRQLCTCPTPRTCRSPSTFFRLSPVECPTVHYHTLPYHEDNVHSVTRKGSMAENRALFEISRSVKLPVGCVETAWNAHTTSEKQAVRRWVTGEDPEFLISYSAVLKACKVWDVKSQSRLFSETYFLKSFPRQMMNIIDLKPLLRLVPAYLYLVILTRLKGAF